MERLFVSTMITCLLLRCIWQLNFIGIFYLRFSTAAVLQLIHKISKLNKLLPVTIVKRAVCNDRLRMLCNSAISSFLPKNLIFQVDYTTIILFYFRNLHFGNSGFECKDKEKLLTIKAFSLVMNKILAAHDTNNPMNSLRRDGSPPLPLPGCHCSRHTSR